MGRMPHRKEQMTMEYSSMNKAQLQAEYDAVAKDLRR